MQTIVETRQGPIQGFADDGIHKFFGIPYAAPPVGALRWRPPQPTPAWTQVRQTTEFGPICPQTAGAVFKTRASRQDEDCLYLNVWTTTVDPQAKQPVMVWIHGGGYLGGGGCEDGTDGSALAALGVTVVSFNYRLGAFGYLAHPDLGSNFGLQDQIAALQWVHQNITQFGGDPDRVTVFGQSAGAHSVRTLLSSPSAAGRFHRAILQSGGGERFSFDAKKTNERTYAASKAFIAHLGGGGPEQLRQVPTERVTEASHLFSGVIPKRGRVHTPANLAWMPVTDGEIVPADAGTRPLAAVPLLLGYTHNEARYFIKPGMLPYNRLLLWALTRALAGPEARAVRTELSHNAGSMYDKFDRAYTSAVFAEPLLATTERLLSSGHEFYCYRFDRVSPGADRSDFRAQHTAELRYLFGTLTTEGYDDVDRQVSARMQAHWVAFARDGAPTEDGSWPRYDDLARIAVIADTPGQGRIDDDPIAPLVHARRAIAR
ncbi:carboxylesterase/lipase family protein [Dactylosporangium sp. NPDC048998]|uniref:carboxylesterase/lipase family protein n=1 Tax=Dactylosporangium sp. NPDC048998 TaxID=3363976 RepID=UPI0037125D5B